VGGWPIGRTLLQVHRDHLAGAKAPTLAHLSTQAGQEGASATMHPCMQACVRAVPSPSCHRGAPRPSRTSCRSARPPWSGTWRASKACMFDRTTPHRTLRRSLRRPSSPGRPEPVPVELGAHVLAVAEHQQRGPVPRLLLPKHTQTQTDTHRHTHDVTPGMLSCAGRGRGLWVRGCVCTCRLTHPPVCPRSSRRRP
jgi:hypothetical protein